VLLLAAGTLFSHGQGTGSVTLSIMPLGDSLTWGYDGGPNTPQYLNSLDNGGYRSPLYLALGADGLNVNFIGSSNGNPSPTLTAAKQTAQDGYNGYRIDDISNNLTASVPGSNGVSNSGGYWLTSVASPDVILLQIGANDIEQRYDPLYTGTGTETDYQLAADTATRLGNLINQIKQYEPYTTLIIDATPELLNGPTFSNTSLYYAADVQSMVASTYQGKNVFFVNMTAALSAAGGYKVYQGDGIHLTDAGYAAMGDAWADAIMSDVNLDNYETVPEPSTYAMFIGGVVALAVWRKLRPRKS
jgi:lysophospholipase L1-like esterase